MAALDDEVAVAAVGAGDGVMTVQVGAGAHGDGILPDLEVDDTRDAALPAQACRALLELPDGTMLRDMERSLSRGNVDEVASWSERGWPVAGGRGGS